MKFSQLESKDLAKPAPDSRGIAPEIRGCPWNQGNQVPTYCILDANFYLSIAKTQEILSEEYQQRRSQRKNAAIEVHDDVLDDLDIEEIREIRHLYDVKERIRIREQQKARKRHSIKNIWKLMQKIFVVCRRWGSWRVWWCRWGCCSTSPSMCPAGHCATNMCHKLTIFRSLCNKHVSQDNTLVTVLQICITRLRSRYRSISA